MLYALHERINGSTDTRRVVSFVVGESLRGSRVASTPPRKSGSKRDGTYPPFTPGVYHPVSEHQSTSTTHEVSAAELLHDIGVRVSAVGADETNGQIGPEGLRLRSLLYSGVVAREGL